MIKVRFDDSDPDLWIKDRMMMQISITQNFNISNEFPKVLNDKDFKVFAISQLKKDLDRPENIAFEVMR